MAITDKQHEPAISDQVLEPAKPQDPVLDEIKAFHETLESERVHRVLVKWRKRKRAEELSNGTSVLEKILRTLHDELESRKARAELWDRALVAELQPDRARQELDGHAAAFGLSLEKKTQFVHAVASVLNIEVSGEEMGKMLSKTTASTALATEPPSCMPPTPPADSHSPGKPHETGTPHVDTQTREHDPTRPPVAPRMPGWLSRAASHVGSRDNCTAPLQGLQPQGPGEVSSRSLLV